MEANYARCTTARRPSKRERVLWALVDGQRLTRFDAERLGDHCLPSTVSALQAQGVPIMRELIERHGQHGAFRCCVYWVAEADRGAALNLLEGMSREAQQTA